MKLGFLMGVGAILLPSSIVNRPLLTVYRCLLSEHDLQDVRIDRMGGNVYIDWKKA